MRDAIRGTAQTGPAAAARIGAPEQATLSKSESALLLGALFTLVASLASFATL